MSFYHCKKVLPIFFLNVKGIAKIWNYLFTKSYKCSSLLKGKHESFIFSQKQTTVSGPLIQSLLLHQNALEKKSREHGEKCKYTPLESFQ